jgi:IS5 family transposase
MIKYQGLSQKPKIFKSLTGVTLSEFKELYGQSYPVWYQQEQDRLNRSNRQRAIGGGRKYELKYREQMLMTLIWLRLYLNTEALGYFFKVDKSTVSRNTRRVLAALRVVGEETLGWPEPPKRGQGKTVEQALREYPDLFALVDATEQSVQRSSDDDTQRQHYSGKKKRHTRKTQLIVNEYGEIRHLTASTPGSIHDIKHFRLSGAGELIPKETTVGGDAGYDGLGNDLPDHSVITSFKARRNHPLNQEQKLLNQEFSRVRIIVENTICQLKHFKVLAHQFRHAVELYDDAFRAVVAIVNPRIKRRVALASVV